MHSTCTCTYMYACTVYVYDCAFIHVLLYALSTGVDHDALVRLAESHFSGLSSDMSGASNNLFPCRYTGSEVSVCQ